MKKLSRFLKSRFPFFSSYHFLYGVWAVFLICNGFSLTPGLNASRGVVVIVALVSLLPLILIPRFGGKKYMIGGGNWMALGTTTALIVAACMGWLEMELVLLVLAFGLGGIFIQAVKRRN